MDYEDVSREPIEPEVIYKNRFTSALTKLFLSWALLVTPFSALITIGELQSGRNKQSIEEEFLRDIPYVPRIVEKLNDVWSRDGRDLGCYLYEKGWRIP